MKAIPIKAPSGLGPDGTRLWSRVMAEFELEVHETELLRIAARQADELAELDKLMPTTPAEQLKLSRERRQARDALSKLIGRIGLDVAQDGDTAGKSVRHRRAALARWKVHDGEAA